MKYATYITVFVIGFILSACAKPLMTNRQVQYQTHSNQVLSKYAGSVSRGFGGSSPHSTRGIANSGAYGVGYQTDYASFGSPTVDYNSWNQANGGFVLKQAMDQEVQDCVRLIKDVPANCGNYPFMVASLTRCLDRVISYRNPLLTYSYQHLDQSGQQYWTYLLNWRQPGNLQNFGVNTFSQLNPYAMGGYIGQDLMQ